jgi:hypothetical protein
VPPMWNLKMTANSSGGRLLTEAEGVKLQRFGGFGSGMPSIWTALGKIWTFRFHRRVDWSVENTDIPI